MNSALQVKGFFILALFTPLVPASGLWTPYPTLTSATVETIPSNSTTITLLQYQSCTIQIRCRERPGEEEDDFKTFLTLFFSNESSSEQKELKTFRSGDPDVPYAVVYGVDPNNHDIIYNVTVNNQGQGFTQVEKLAIKVDYIYNRLRNRISFTFNVSLKDEPENIEELSGTTSTTIMETTSPAVSSKCSEYTAILVSMIVVLGATCLILSIAVVILVSILSRLYKRKIESGQDTSSPRRQFKLNWNVSPINDSNSGGNDTPNSRTNNSSKRGSCTPCRLIDNMPPNLSESSSDSRTSETELVPQDKAESSHKL